MGAVRMRVQTADKNITIIHTTSVHQLTFCEEKSCVCEKQIHHSMDLFIHIIAFSSEKVIESESGEKYAQIKQ